MENALSISHVTKVYQNGPKALDNISFSIEEGDFFALLGHNGAGKSTLIGIITSLIRKNSGKIYVFGHDQDLEPSLVKSYIGVVPQEININIFEKVIDVVIHQAGYYGIPKKDATGRAEVILKELKLWEKRNTQTMHLSGGMKRRLMIARALVHQPKLLILDEPTAGVDVELRKSTWEYITRLNKEKKVTIILTTHYLEEAENFCNNIAIINNGSLITLSSVSELIRTLDTHSISFDLVDELQNIPQELANLPDVKFELKNSVTLKVEIKKNTHLNTVIQILEKSNIKVSSVKNKANRLEELFIKLTKNGN